MIPVIVQISRKENGGQDKKKLQNKYLNCKYHIDSTLTSKKQESVQKKRTGTKCSSLSRY